MSKYAKDTKVPVDRSMSEIRRTLARYEAAAFALIEKSNQAGVAFEMCNRRVRFVIPMPDMQDYRRNTAGVAMGDVKSQQAYDKEVRRRWRALLLVIKAKLEAVESGVESFEEAFMAQLVLPDGQTMTEWAKPQIEQAYLSGKMPPLLGSGS